MMFSVLSRGVRSSTSLLCACALATLQACGRHADEAARPAGTPEIEFAVAQRADAPLVTELPGRIEPYRTAEVRARVDGIVLKRTYDEGQVVKAGQVLFRIDPAPLKAQVDAAQGALARAQAQLSIARDKAARYKGLAATHAVSELEYAEAQAAERQAAAEVISARAALETAQLRLGYATVTAPITGRSRRAQVTEGALVKEDAATPLTTVEQIDPIYVDFAQPAAEVLALQRALKTGQAAALAAKDIGVQVILSDGVAYERPGKLLFSDLAVDRATDNVSMRAVLPNPDGLLLPGMYVRVRLSHAVQQGAVAVPKGALQRDRHGASVFVVQADDTLAMRAVTAQTLAGDQWLVTSGLSGGERIAIPGMQTLGAGMAVKPVPTGERTGAKPQKG
ncbi:MULTISPECIES: efflux RND transporter periplasmic adaptor subunit [Ralstonia]|uniref:efflux RND transporter periplasmic adaptor subunit n=1 Tax=Ralstonia TaxID=48736 RepID=UPI000A4CD054|nr:MULTISPECIES: efflux RND transporter periplasmic adaptor subunit [Ralstonia]PLT18597.1 efflux transporter periplasmic adaptor subunit [Ralstonia mannitolilytica]